MMYRLYRITHDPEHLRMASLFDKDNFYQPLIAGQDALPGRHANTHLAQVRRVGAPGLMHHTLVRDQRQKAPARQCSGPVDTVGVFLM